MHYDALRNSLYAVVDYPDELTALIGDAKPWRAFCGLPLEVKQRFQFLDHHDGADPGYRLRTRAEGREDKEYFHIYPDTYELIEKDGLAELVAGTPALKEFFDYAVAVQREVNAFSLDLCREFAKQSPGFARLLNGGDIRSMIRFLHYVDDGDIIAEQHFDRSLYTLHAYESHPGLQFLNFDMEWEDAPIGSGKTVVFTGYRGEKLTDGELQKTWHRVVRKAGTNDRISLVLFVWSKDVECYDRDTRSREFTPSYVRPMA